jgi:hypothetical protein
VSKEILYWLDHKSADTLLIAITEGELAWNDRTVVRIARAIYEEIVRRIHTLTKEDWDEVIGNIKRGHYLDSAAFRKKADEFALALEKKGCQAHRDADRLDADERVERRGEPVAFSLFGPTASAYQ